MKKDANKDSKNTFNTNQMTQQLYFIFKIPINSSLFRWRCVRCQDATGYEWPQALQIVGLLQADHKTAREREKEFETSFHHDNIAQHTVNVYHFITLNELIIIRAEVTK